MGALFRCGGFALCVVGGCFVSCVCVFSNVWSFIPVRVLCMTCGSSVYCVGVVYNVLELYWRAGV